MCSPQPARGCGREPPSGWVSGVSQSFLAVPAFPLGIISGPAGTLGRQEETGTERLQDIPRPWLSPPLERHQGHLEQVEANKMFLPPGQRSAHPSPMGSKQPGLLRLPRTAEETPPWLQHFLQGQTPAAGGPLLCQHSQGQEIAGRRDVRSLRSRHEQQSTQPRPQAQGKGDVGAHVTRKAEASLSWEGHVEDSGTGRHFKPLPHSVSSKPLHSPRVTWCS